MPERKTTRLPFRDRWLAVMLQTPRLSCCVQVLLAVLYADMEDDGTVLVRRDELCRLLNKGRTVVQGRLREAVGAGFLVRQKRGQKGQHPVYQASIPVLSDRFSDRPGVTAESGVQGPENPVAEVRSVTAPGWSHITRAVTAESTSGNGAVDDRRADDDADLPHKRWEQRVTPDSDTQDHDGGMRGQGAGVPLGVDHVYPCRDCGGVNDRGGLYCHTCKARRLAS